MANRVVYEKLIYDSEIEYLESTGTQWIDTDFKPDSTTTSFELDISFEGQFVYSRTSKTIIKTSVTESNTQKFSMNFGDASLQENEIFLWFGRAYDGHTVPNSLNEVALTRGIFSYSQGIGSYNGKSVNLNSKYPPVAGRREGTMLILKDFECYNARLYGAKIWDNNILVRDFIPVHVGSIGYMYDKVSGRLFSNQGTGNFILGQDIPNTIPNNRCILYTNNQRCIIEN